MWVSSRRSAPEAGAAQTPLYTRGFTTLPQKASAAAADRSGASDQKRGGDGESQKYATGWYPTVSRDQ